MHAVYLTTSETNRECTWPIPEQFHEIATTTIFHTSTYSSSLQNTSYLLPRSGSAPLKALTKALEQQKRKAHPKTTNFDSKLQDRASVCSYLKRSLLEAFIAAIEQDTAQSSSYLPSQLAECMHVGCTAHARKTNWRPRMHSS